MRRFNTESHDPTRADGSAEVHNGLEPRCFTGKKPITLDIAEYSAYGEW
jgi:hypothetical protein